MKIEKIQFDDVQYNPEREAFVAVVKVHDAGEVFSYPAEVLAPLHAEYGLIVRRLAQQAHKAHNGQRGGFRLHHDCNVTAPALQPRKLAMFERIFGDAAA